MSFLTGPRIELIQPFIKIHRKKGRPIIPLGEQVLHLDKIERKQSKNGNEMIVLTIRKKPEEGESGKMSYHPLILYNMTDYSYKRACDSSGVPFGIVQLKKFFLEAYGYKLEGKGKTMDVLLDGLVEQSQEFKKSDFIAVVRYKTSLAKDVYGNAVTRERGSLIRIGQPIINYEPDIWMVSKIDSPINLAVALHEKLILPLPVGEQNEFAKLFNEKIECDYQQGFLSVQNQEKEIFGKDFK